MKIQLTEEQEMLRASARDFLEKECTEAVIRNAEASGLGYSPDLWQKIAQLGWSGLVFPQRFGGSGMEVADLAVLCEELGRSMFPGPFVSAIVVGGLTILEAGTEEQKSSILPGLVDGNEMACVVLNEPDPRSGGAFDPERVAITFAPDGDGYVLKGNAEFVMNAHMASAFLVPATESTPKDTSQHLTLFWVEPSAPGITVTRLASAAGDCPCQVVFNDVHVPGRDIIGDVGGGRAPLAKAFQIGAVMMSAQMLGSGEKLLQAVADDYETRTQSDESARDEHTLEYIARLRQELDNCRAVTYEQIGDLPQAAADEGESN
jgi:alkylation response protein AidB-like acyl-CoA dehydrogenase